MKSPRLKTTLVPYDQLIDLGSYFIALYLSVVLFITFLWAYLFNDFVFSARINDFGEAHWELVLLCGLILFLFYGLVVRYKNLRYKIHIRRHV